MDAGRDTQSVPSHRLCFQFSIATQAAQRGSQGSDLRVSVQDAKDLGDSGRVLRKYADVKRCIQGWGVGHLASRRWQRS